MSPTTRVRLLLAIEQLRHIATFAQGEAAVKIAAEAQRLERIVRDADWDDAEEGADAL